MSRLCLLVIGWLAVAMTAGPAYAQVLVDADAAAPGVQATRNLVDGESGEGRLVLLSGGQPVGGLDVELTFDARVLSIREARLVGIAAGAYEIINSPIAGSLRVALVREGAALASSDAVLRLVFDTVGTGSTTLAIATSKVSGPAGAHLDLSTASASVVVRQRLFVDDPIVPGVTVVRATHITELRALIDQKRAAGRLPAFAWTDSSPLVMSAVHVLEMRAALAAVYAAAGQPAPTYTDATLIAGATVIRAVHINELRTAAVNAP